MKALFSRLRKGMPGLAVWCLILVVLSLSLPTFTASAQSSPQGGLGVGRNQGLETGINVDNLNRLRADINAGMYNRPCTAAEHNPNKWHTLVNIEAKCHYDHQHNDDPNYVNDLFGQPGAWFGMPGQEISYPWQTFAATSASEPNTQAIAERRMENDIKHEGYIWIVRRDQPCPDGNCIVDFRLQTHAIMGAADMPVRYHSFSLEARVCVDKNRPDTCGIVRYGGWIDMGRLFTTAPNDINCGHDVRDIAIPLPADNLFRPLDRPEARDEIRCHPDVETLPAYPPTRPLAEWWGKAGGETRFQVRSFDPIGNVNHAAPAEWDFFCHPQDMNCRYDASMFSVFVGYVLQIFEFYRYNGQIVAQIDNNRDGRSDLRAYFSRMGGINPNCTTVGLDCVPYQYDNVVLNFFQNKEARYFHTVCDNCMPIDYDISPPGQRWITWFYRYARPGQFGTPTPPPVETTPPPVETTPPPVETTPPPPGAAVIVAVNPASAPVGSPVSVDLKLQDVSGVYGLQALCVVDPGVLAGTGSAGGDVFTNSNSYLVDKGFQGDGRWTTAASLLQPNPAFSGMGVAYRLNYTVQNVGSSAVTCTALVVDENGDEIPVTVYNGSFNGAPVNTPPPTETTPPPVETTPPPVETTPPPGGMAVINGVVAFQNAPDSAGITVQLVSGETVMATTTTGANGSFSFSNVPMGTFGVTAAAPLHLRVGKVVAVMDANPINVGTLVLPGGDTNGDNSINVTDAGLVGANFDMPVNPAPAEADINQDGMVNIRDLAIVGGNYGLTAPIIYE